MAKMLRNIAPLGGLAMLVATPAYAQQAGDVVVRAAVARTKLVDEGVIRIDGVNHLPAPPAVLGQWRRVLTSSGRSYASRRRPSPTTACSSDSSI